MENRIVHLIRRSWLVNDRQCAKMLDKVHAIPLGNVGIHIPEKAGVLLKWKADGKTHFDEAAIAIKNETDGSIWLKATGLKDLIENKINDKELIILICDHSGAEISVKLVIVGENYFSSPTVADDFTRYENYDIPPRSMITVDTESIVKKIVLALNKTDPELIAESADKFLSAPHVIVPLFSHVMQLTSEENIKFPVILKKVADQLRTLLTEEEKSRIHIRKIEKSHRDTWTKARGKRIAFIDGGVRRVDRE